MDCFVARAPRNDGVRVLIQFSNSFPLSSSGLMRGASTSVDHTGSIDRFAIGHARRAGGKE
jgi:hypothetical protein